MGDSTQCTFLEVFIALGPAALGAGLFADLNTVFIVYKAVKSESTLNLKKADRGFTERRAELWQSRKEMFPSVAAFAV